jgi:hypothetical protein
MPQERHDAFVKELLGSDWFKPAPSVIYACRDSTGKGSVAIGSRLAVKVRELSYPGGPPQGAEVEVGEQIKEKWLYVFREKRLVVELRADDAGVWIKGNSSGADFRGASQSGELVFDPGKKEARKQYAFFLSPARLTDDAIQILTKGDALTRAAVTVGPAATGTVVLLPDPYQWAADAQRLYHGRCAANFLALVTGEQPTAKWLIARRLEAWCRASPKIAGQLKVRPEDWLMAHTNVKSRLHGDTRVAVSYLAHCVDSPGFVAVQKACEGGGADGISMGMQALASVTEGLLVTREGLDLALRLATRPEFLASRFIFHDEKHEPDDKLWWNERRWGWQAMASIFEDVAPAMVEYWKHRGKEINANPRFRMAQYLKNIGIPCDVGSLKVRQQKAPSKAQRTLYANLAADRKITAGSLSRLERTRVRKEFEGLIKKKEVRDGYFPTAFDKRAEKLDRLHGFFQPVSQFTRLTVGTMVEGVNVSFALSDFAEAKEKGEANAWKGFALAGAFAEAGEHLAACVEQLKRTGTVGKTVIKGTAAFLGLVSSASDLIEYEEATLDAAVGSYDYGKAIGHGTQMAGAALGAVGGGFALAEVLGAGSVAGATLGAWLGGIGAVLVIGGALLAEALKLDDQEIFAQRSFLGRVGAEPASIGKALPWTMMLELPTRDPRVEARALLMLEGTFQVAWFSSIGNDTRLLIRPGLVYGCSKFEIELETSWSNWGRSRFAIAVNLQDDDIVQVSGPMLLKKDGVIERDGGWNVTEISINVEDPTLPRDRPGQWQVVRAWVRFDLDGRVFVPDKAGLGVQSSVPAGAPILSRDKSAWKTKAEWEGPK